MKYAFYLGCTIPARSRNYEMSARLVAEKLGLELVDIEKFLCCGFPVKTSDLQAAEVMGAYNLALAEAQGLDIVALCSSCTSALTELAHHLKHHAEARERVNQELAKVGLKFEGNVRVRHFARILHEDFGPEQLKAHFVKDLSPLKVGLHYGCHFLKPSEVYENFDEVEDPQTMDELVSLTGAQVVDYPFRKRCCGGPLLPVDAKLAMSISQQKLEDLSAAGANSICLVCPFCSVMYDDNQKSIEAEYGRTYNLPVLYLTQILGMAMGMGQKELGLNMNVVKTKGLVAQFYES